MHSASCWLQKNVNILVFNHWPKHETMQNSMRGDYVPQRGLETEGKQRIAVRAPSILRFQYFSFSSQSKKTVRNVLETGTDSSLLPVPHLTSAHNTAILSWNQAAILHDQDDQK